MFPPEPGEKRSKEQPRTNNNKILLHHGTLRYLCETTTLCTPQHSRSSWIQLLGLSWASNSLHVSSSDSTINQKEWNFENHYVSTGPRYHGTYHVFLGVLTCFAVAVLLFCHVSVMVVSHLSMYAPIVNY